MPHSFLLQEIYISLFHNFKDQGLLTTPSTSLSTSSSFVTFIDHITSPYLPDVLYTSHLSSHTSISDTLTPRPFLPVHSFLPVKKKACHTLPVFLLFGKLPILVKFSKSSKSLSPSLSDIGSIVSLISYMTDPCSICCFNSYSSCPSSV